LTGAEGGPIALEAKPVSDAQRVKALTALFSKIKAASEADALPAPGPASDD